MHRLFFYSTKLFLIVVEKGAIAVSAHFATWQKDEKGVQCRPWFEHWRNRRLAANLRKVDAGQRVPIRFGHDGNGRIATMRPSSWSYA